MWDLLLTSLGKYVNPTTDDRNRIRELFEVKNFRRHQYILQEGEPAKNEMFIVKGLTRTSVSKAANRERELEFLGNVTDFRRAEVLGLGVSGAISYVTWSYDYTHRQWGEKNYTQVSVQEWRQGKIIREIFIYN